MRPNRALDEEPDVVVHRDGEQRHLRVSVRPYAEDLIREVLADTGHAAEINEHLAEGLEAAQQATRLGPGDEVRAEAEEANDR